MIELKLAQTILRNLNVEPTKSQVFAIEQLAKFLYGTNPNSIFLLKGYAGTGKTHLLSTLVTTLSDFKINTVLLAPTGRAAKVLTLYSNKSAFTIHKKIFRQKSSSDIHSKFSLDFNKHANTLFIVDESSMISNESTDQSFFGSGRLLDDLIEYVYSGKNCRLMLVGDTAQLPPVGLSVSPALDANILEMYNKTVLSATLIDVVRQQHDSLILKNATFLRELIDDQLIKQFFNIEIKRRGDVIKLSGEDLIETIGSCYSNYGEEDTIVVTRSNKRANKFNEGIRRTILWREEEISSGDLIMVIKNNYYWKTPDKNIDFIANGDIARIVRFKGTEELYGFRFATVTVQLIDYDDAELDCKIMLDTLNIETASLSYEENLKLFHAIQEDYMDIPNKKKRFEKIRENEYFNALQVKFAYAITCHKAQGGQWSSVFLDHGYLTEDMLGVDLLRWMYTAFTRPQKKLYLVNFNKQFFE